MSLWTDGLEAVPRTGSATRPEAAGGFVRQRSSDRDAPVLGMDERVPKCTVVHVLKQKDNTYEAFVDGIAQDFDPTEVVKEVKLRRFFGPHYDPVTETTIVGPVRICALMEDGALPPERIVVRLMCEFRQELSDRTESVVMSSSELSPGRMDSPVLDSVVTPFPSIHTPPPAVRLEDRRKKQVQNATKYNKMFSSFLLMIIPGLLSAAMPSTLAAILFTFGGFKFVEEIRSPENLPDLISSLARPGYWNEAYDKYMGGNPIDADDQKKYLKALISIFGLIAMMLPHTSVGRVMETMDQSTLASLLMDKGSDNKELIALLTFGVKGASALKVPERVRTFKYTVRQLIDALKLIANFSTGKESHHAIDLRRNDFVREGVIADWIMQSDAGFDLPEIDVDSFGEDAQGAGAAVFDKISSNGVLHSATKWRMNFTGFDTSILQRDRVRLYIEIEVEDSQQTTSLPLTWRVKASHSVGIQAGNIGKAAEMQELKQTIKQFKEKVATQDASDNHFLRRRFKIPAAAWKRLWSTFNVADDIRRVGPIGQIFAGMVAVTKYRLSSQATKLSSVLTNPDSVPQRYIDEMARSDRKLNFVDTRYIIRIFGHRVRTASVLFGAVRVPTETGLDNTHEEDGPSRGQPAIQDASAEATRFMRRFSSAARNLLDNFESDSSTRCMVLQCYQAQSAFATGVALPCRPYSMPTTIPPVEIADAEVAVGPLPFELHVQLLQMIGESRSEGALDTPKQKKNAPALSAYSDAFVQGLLQSSTRPRQLSLVSGPHRLLKLKAARAKPIVKASLMHGCLDMDDPIFLLPGGAEARALFHATGAWERTYALNLAGGATVAIPESVQGGRNALLPRSMQTLRLYKWPKTLLSRIESQTSVFESTANTLKLDQASLIPMSPLQNALGVCAPPRGQEYVYSEAELSMASIGVDCARRCVAAADGLRIPAQLVVALALRAYPVVELVARASMAPRFPGADGIFAQLLARPARSARVPSPPERVDGLLDRNASLRVDYVPTGEESVKDLADNMALVSLNDAPKTALFYVPYAYGSFPPTPVPYGFLGVTAIESVPVNLGALVGIAKEMVESRSSGSAAPATVRVEALDRARHPYFVELESGAAPTVKVRQASCVREVRSARLGDGANNPLDATTLSDLSKGEFIDEKDENDLRHVSGVIGWNTERVLQAAILIGSSASFANGAEIVLQGPPPPQLRDDTSLMDAADSAGLETNRQLKQSTLGQAQLSGESTFQKLKLALDALTKHVEEQRKVIQRIENNAVLDAAAGAATGTSGSLQPDEFGLDNVTIEGSETGVVSAPTQGFFDRFEPQWRKDSKAEWEAIVADLDAFKAELDNDLNTALQKPVVDDTAWITSGLDKLEAALAVLKRDTIKQRFQTFVDDIKRKETEIYDRIDQAIKEVQEEVRFPIPQRLRDIYNRHVAWMFNNVDYDSSPASAAAAAPAAASGSSSTDPPQPNVAEEMYRPVEDELKLFEINLKTARAITNYETLRTGSSNADLNAFNARMNAIATALSACMAESILPQGARPIVQLHDSDDLTALRRVANVESPKEFPVVTFSEACMLLASL